jgi:hypothetical protein
LYNYTTQLSFPKIRKYLVKCTFTLCVISAQEEKPFSRYCDTRN